MCSAAEKPNRMLSCINKDITKRERLSYPTQQLSGLTVFILVSIMLKSCGLAGDGPGKGHKHEQWLRKSAIQGKAEKTGFVQLEKRRLNRNLISIFQYLKDVCKEDGDSCRVTWKRERVMGTI